MSVFEELIDELKEENLLEETVFSRNTASPSVLPDNTDEEPTKTRALDEGQEPDEEDTGRDAEFDPEHEVNFGSTPTDERETYRRRAMDEVSSLQMVEHVLSGIEREHMKMTPASYDDLEVKKALHKYLQVTGPISSDEHSKAEYHLFHETEKWFSALAVRDNNISVANIRRFCENSRPILSSQALIALARFYRNSPFAEAARGKFDFVMTRLFSREIGDEKRKLLFGRVETLRHIKTLYSNWASLAVSEGEDGSEPITQAVSNFEAFIREADSAEEFDQLIRSDFFNRIRIAKEQTVDLFFEPAVLAAAIECNVRIGNRFIDLIHRAREAAGEATIEDRYGYVHDTAISNAASKTLLLLDLLREAHAPEEVRTENKPGVSKDQQVVEFERAPVEERGLTVNKWLLGATVLVVFLSLGLYFWSENVSAPQSNIEVAAGVDISGTDLTTHLRSASLSSETLYGITEPTWDSLQEDEKKEFLSKAFNFAKSKGIKKINFLNSRGRTVAYASDNRLEVFGPQ
ncbi:MAG TPA: hypothetical protein VFZ49_03275 [Pyrinomonadaceae bacterium]